MKFIKAVFILGRLALYAAEANIAVYDSESDHLQSTTDRFLLNVF